MAKAILRPTTALIGCIIMGALLFGIPLAIDGAARAARHPEFVNKNGEHETPLGRAAECFVVGALVGGVLGGIPGFFVSRRLRKSNPAS
jgi:hypothetical protein